MRTHNNNLEKSLGFSRRKSEHQCGQLEELRENIARLKEELARKDCRGRESAQTLRVMFEELMRLDLAVRKKADQLEGPAPNDSFSHFRARRDRLVERANLTLG